MRIRILHFILFSCLVIGCTSKSSKKGMVNFDSIQIVKPNYVFITIEQPKLIRNIRV